MIFNKKSRIEKENWELDTKLKLALKEIEMLRQLFDEVQKEKQDLWYRLGKLSERFVEFQKAPK